MKKPFTIQRGPFSFEVAPAAPYPGIYGHISWRQRIIKFQFSCR